MTDAPRAPDGEEIPAKWKDRTWRHWGQHALNVWFSPYDVINVRVFETFFALTWLYWFTSYFPTLWEWVTPHGYHISVRNHSWHYAIPAPLIPEGWVVPIAGVFTVLTVLYILGLWRRILVWCMFVGAVYLQAVDQPSAFTLSKLYIFYFFLLGLQPPPQRRPGADEDEPLVISAWPVRLMQLTLVVEYTTAGTCKFFWGDWLFQWTRDGLTLGNPHALWTHAQGLYKNPISSWLVNVLPYWFWVAFTLSAMGWEMCGGAFFVWRKTRYLIGMGYGVCMHLGIAILMQDLIYFSLQMITFYIVWVDPKDLRMVLKWMRDHLLPDAMAKRIVIKDAGGSPYY